MLLGVMMTYRRGQWLVLAGFIVIAVSGCGGRGWREYLGLATPSDPSVAIRSAEPRWLLIKNPRCCDIPSEPEYTWVEEDKLPTTVKSFVFGQSTLIAPPEVVAKYGAPPGGGRISARQGGAYKVENVVPTIPTSRSAAAAVSNTTRTDALLGELDEEVASGRVVEVRDKFSVVEVQKAAAGVQVQVKDRVVLR